MADPPPRQSPTRSPSIMSLLNPAPANEPFFGGAKRSPEAASPPVPALPTPPISATTPGPDGPAVPRSNSIRFLTGSPAGGVSSASARAFGKRPVEDDGGPEKGVNGFGANGIRSEPLSRNRSSPGSATADLPDSGSNPRKRPRTSGEIQTHSPGSPAQHPFMPPPARAASAYGGSTNGQHRTSLGTPVATAAGSASGSPHTHSPSSSISRPLPSTGTAERPLSASSGTAPDPSPRLVTSPASAGPSGGYFGIQTRSPIREGNAPLPAVEGRRGSSFEDGGPALSSSSRPSTSTMVAPPPPPPQHPHPSAGLESLEPSVFGVPPLDEFTVEVGAWIWAWVEHIWAQGEGRMIEIEAKIGILRNLKTAGPRMPAQRLTMPIAVETILTDSTDIRFESNMTEKQHKRYNQILNARVEESASKQYRGAPIKYSHRYEADEFYGAEGGPSGPGRGKKIRVTRDQKTGVIPEKGVIVKERVADMNVFSPKRTFDFRISINIERPTQQPRGAPSYRRFKDRISYSHQLCNIDLTQVKTEHPQEEPLHELEIEFRDSFELLKQAERHAHGQTSTYHDMLQVFLNNVRMLIRNAPEPSA